MHGIVAGGATMPCTWALSSISHTLSTIIVVIVNYVIIELYIVACKSACTDVEFQSYDIFLS